MVLDCGSQTDRMEPLEEQKPEKLLAYAYAQSETAVSDHGATLCCSFP
jgi:hypothetical protein